MTSENYLGGLEKQFGVSVRRRLALVAMILALGMCSTRTEASGGSGSAAGPRSSAQGEKKVAAVLTPSTALAGGGKSGSPGTAAQPGDSASVSDDFKIGPDDVLAVNVWREAEVSQTVTVRPDGKISLPLAGEFVASGLTPKQLEAVISGQLENYLSHPEVTVIVHEVKSRHVVVAGQVAKPGSYTLQTSMTVLDAIAQAGGPLDYAKLHSIYVLRTGPDGHPVKLKFDYKEVIHGKNLGQNIQLDPHDTVVVP